jgi:hypothetical protein
MTPFMADAMLVGGGSESRSGLLERRGLDARHPRHGLELLQADDRPLGVGARYGERVLQEGVNFEVA